MTREEKKRAGKTRFKKHNLLDMLNFERKPFNNFKNFIFSTISTHTTKMFLCIARRRGTAINRLFANTSSTFPSFSTPCPLVSSSCTFLPLLVPCPPQPSLLHHYHSSSSSSSSAPSSSSSSPPSSLRPDLLEQETEIAKLMHETRHQLLNGSLHQALQTATECLEKVTLAYSKRHLAYAAGLNNLALVHKLSGENEKAITLYTEALTLYEEIAGKESPSTATAAANLGLLHIERSKKTKGLEKVNHVDAAKTLLERALRAREAALGATHAMVGVSLYQLASALRMQKKYADAEAMLQKSLRVLRESPDVGDKAHASTATALNNLGYLYKEIGDYDQAEDMYGQALRMRKELFGEKHQDSIATLYNLAECKRARGEEEKAVEIQKDILRILGHTSTADENDDVGVNAGKSTNTDTNQHKNSFLEQEARRQQK